MTVSEQLEYLQNCINDVWETRNGHAVEILRAILDGAAARAPVDALIELAETLVKIRKRDQRLEDEQN
jgi:hypothetical protein